MTRVLAPTSVIKAKIGINPGGRVQRFFTHECRRRMDKYVPKDSGALRDTAVEGTDYVAYIQPYANYQYRGLSKSGQPLKYKTPGTGSYWDKKMWSAEKNQVIKATQKYMEGK